MAYSALFSFESFDFGASPDIVDPFLSSNSYDHTRLVGTEDWEDLNNLYSDFDQNNLQKQYCLHHQHEQKEAPLSSFDLVSSPFQGIADLDSIPTEHSDMETRKEKEQQFSLVSQELQNYYKSGIKKMKREELNSQHEEVAIPIVNHQRLSTEEVMRVAGAWYTQFSVQMRDDIAMATHPFASILSGLTNDELREVELAHLLLASAEKVALGQFDRAKNLLIQCGNTSSRTDTPVQRVVYYFSKGLLDRIDQATRTVHYKELRGREEALDVEEALMTPKSELVALHQAFPLSNVTQFAGIQTIVENVGSAKKVHLIDLGIKSGMPWTVLMQAFASSHGSPLELLKITFIGTKCQEKIEETGKRLASFAQSMNMPFSYEVVMVLDIRDLNEELFEIKNDEVIVIYAAMVLRNMLHQPDQLESLMRVVRNIRPCLMVVIEVEANHNSPFFANRFVESLFFYSAFFDCLDSCIGLRSHDRMVIEAYLGKGIHNMLTTEGQERKARNVGIDMWRAFFTRFGMVEVKLSHSSLYQASLVLKKFGNGRSCTLEMNGKCLLAGWKGTPIHSLSAWTFKKANTYV